MIKFIPSFKLNAQLAVFEALLKRGFKESSNGYVTDESSSSSFSGLLAILSVTLFVFIKTKKYPDLMTSLLAKLPSFKGISIEDDPEIKLSSNGSSIQSSSYYQSIPNFNLSDMKGIEYRAINSKGDRAFGSRINNPLNVRPSSPSNPWQGQVGVYTSKSSGEFAEFSDPFYSFRAASKAIENYRKGGDANRNRILEKYGNGVGTLTLSSMLHIYAPTSENDTNAYIRSIS